MSARLRAITQIADRDDTLALNTAIEVAHAGDQGRGLSVVADEVRTLAERTQSAVQEVRPIADKLNNSSGEAVGR